MNDFNARLIEAFPDKRIVPGFGNRGARVVMIGEAPGEKEAELLRPFVGKAGRNLDEFLEMSGIERSDLYITNAVKFRPTAEGKKGLVNRKPSKSETEAFRSWLLEELALIDPVCVVTLGNVPLQVLAGNGITIGEVHGSFITGSGFRVYPMYHPASVIYNRSLSDVYKADVMALGEWMRANV